MGDYSDELLRILSLLKENPKGLAVSDIAAKIGVNRNTVSRYLDMLRISGQVDMKTYGKAKVFYTSQRAPISAMLNFSSDPVAIIDSEFYIVQVNDALCALLNIQRSDILGKELRKSALVGFDHPVIHERLHSALEGEETTDEINIVRAGEERYYKIKIVPTVLSDSSPGITIILEDTTEEKNATEAMKKSEHNFRSLVEEINDAIWDIDDEGRFIYASPRTVDILGVTSEDILGKSLYEFVQKDSLSDVKKSVKSAAESNQSVLSECTLLRVKNIADAEVKSGQSNIRSMTGMTGNAKTLGAVENSDANSDNVAAVEEIRAELSISPKCDELGFLLGYRVVGRNISARDNALKGLFKWKSFLTSIVNNIPSMVVVKEVRNGTYIHFNKSAEDFFGLKEDHDIGRMGCEIFQDSVTEFFVSGDKEIGLCQKPIIMPEFVMKNHGVLHILRVKKVPIFSIDNKLEYILTLIDDITEDKKIERELIEKNSRARSYLDVAGVMICVIDRDGIIEDINKKGSSLLGYEENELIGKNWFETVVPKDERSTLCRRFNDAVRGKVSLRSDVHGRILKSDGSIIDVIWQNSFLKDLEGNVIAVVTSVTEKI